MLETKLDELTAQLKRVADALEANAGAAPAADPPAEKPKRTRRTKAQIAAEKAAAEAEDEDEEDDSDEEEAAPPKKTARKSARKSAKKAARKKAKEPEPEDDEEEDDEFEEDEDTDEEGPIDYKTVADHIRKTREGLIKKSGTKGVVPHKKITKQLLDDWGVGKVSEIEDEQLPEFYQDLRAAEKEAGI